MLGVIVNAAAVVAGSLIGMIFKKGLPERIRDAVMKGVALCVLYIGNSGTLKGSNTLVLILSIVIGTIIGESADLDGKLNSFANKLEKRFQKTGSESASLAEGFVSAACFFVWAL